MTPLRADLHVHTYHSGDSALSLERLIERCREVGINCLAVTDHDSIDGAVELQKTAPFKVIIGEEIKTSEGEIMGLFLKEPVPKGLSPEESVARIKAQGGLASVSHPFDRMRSSTLKESALRRIVHDLDAIEVFNSRTTLNRHNARARAFALAHDLPMLAGSDAHTAYELGATYVELPDFDSADEFKAALARSTMYTRRANPLVHLASYWARWQKKGARRQ
jgi:hypothetical protein